jgi:voltage-gated potassium channel
MPTQFKFYVRQVLFGDPELHRGTRIFNYFFFSLILASILGLILESVPDFEMRYAKYFQALEFVVVIIFTVEYLLRIWVYPGRQNIESDRSQKGARYSHSYILTFHGLIDLLATAPFYLQTFFPGLDLRFLRAIRMLRVLKFSHHNTALEDLFTAVYEERHSIFSAGYILSIAILITSCFAYFAESLAQPDKFGSIPDAMWWSVITLTTVGYGDVSPVTPFGKVIGVITAFAGVCTVAVLTGIVAASFTNQLARKKAIFESRVLEIISRGGEEFEFEALRQSLNLSRHHASDIVDKLVSLNRER